MNGLILLLLTIIPPADGVLRESVEMIEKNHFYDDCGKQIFAQWLFYDFDGYRHQVRAWRLDEGQMHFTQRPPVLTWCDKDGKERQVSGKYWRETFTQWDVEIEEQDWLPKDRRKGLRTR